ncbi:MAG TPA: (d)CMP kinase [Candidatus Avimuribaculum pullicola]|nr:(d)CMP kinase [Candidatus Avimuribaculum pullicola]
MERKRIIIAIDGFSSTGKSTMAKTLARRIGYAYIDTGAMYRAVTLFALDNGLTNGDGTVNETALTAQLGEIAITFNVNPTTGQSETYLNGQCVEREIRSMRVSSMVSQVAKIAAVRRALVAQQQAMGRSKGIVMDGRDIGTVVFPDAEMKVYVTASAETRAHRRHDELVAKGDTSTTYEEVLHNVMERDRIDTTRAESPLRKADDAYTLDNSHMTIAEQDQWLIDLYDKISEGTNDGNN